MAVLRVEKSNPEYSPAHTTFYTLHSSHIAGRGNASVYNDDASGKDLPIIVLMHGVYGNHWVWMHLGGVHLVFERLKKAGLGEFVLLMPSDGGYRDGSGYLPIHGPDARILNYEKWIMEDVLSAIIENTPCLGEQSKIYLTGLSMGGYGALRLGAKYAEKVSGISAHSAVTTIDDLLTFTPSSRSDYHCVDQNEGDIIRWLEENKRELAPIRMDCGIDDSLFNSNVALSKAMHNLAIAHQFEHFSGEHSWEYWHEHIAKTFSFFNTLHYGNTF